eukprot:scaffold74416_cov41-Cyclotella_meneghiniana.AAC.1
MADRDGSGGSKRSHLASSSHPLSRLLLRRRAVHHHIDVLLLNMRCFVIGFCDGACPGRNHLHSVLCRSIQCIESKGIRTDANVYHNLINQQSTRHIASVSVIERDVTKHRRDNIIIMNKKRHKQRQKSNNQIMKKERHKQRQKSNNQLKKMRSSVFSKIIVKENTMDTTINQAWLYS